MNDKQKKEINEINEVIAECNGILDGIRSDAAVKVVLDWCNGFNHAKSQNELDANNKRYNDAIAAIFKAHRR